MSFWDAISSALSALRANRLRSALTVLGTVVGVVAVVAVMAITQGLNRYVAQEMLSMGSHIFSVDKFGMITSQDDWFAALKRRDLSRDHADYLRDHVTTAAAVVPMVDRTVDVQWGGERAEDVNLSGLSGDYPALGDLFQLASGRQLTPSEGETGGRLTVIGSELADELFGAVDPVGQRVRIGGHTFWVIGVLAARGKVLGQSRDNVALIPIETFESLYGRRRSISIAIKAAAPEVYADCQEEVAVLLKVARGLQPWDEPDFGLQTSETYFEVYRQTTGLVYLGMIAVVALSLVVGGIVMMNIMLVAVTERTQEIGIRKAVGARQRDILLQFLVEATVLAGSGGIIGVLLGGAIATLVDHLSPLPARVEVWSVVVSLMMAISVGLVAGLYPARRAASMPPVQALSYEK